MHKAAGCHTNEQVLTHNTKRR